MSRRLDLRQPISYEADDNVASYRPEEDGRNTRPEDRVRYIPAGLVHPSSFQTRLVATPADDLLLEQDIETHGLTHPPLLRPHPVRAGEYEIVAGHRRVAALRRLAEQGWGTRVLRGSGAPEAMLLPAIVESMDDRTAHAKTVLENLIRRDLSPWEQSWALVRHEASMRAAGLPTTVRDIAVDIGRRHPTIAPYLRVGHTLTPSVLALADAMAGTEADHVRLARLSLEALRRVAQAPTEELRAKRLRLALSRGQGRAQPVDRHPQDQQSRPADGTTVADVAESRLERGLQINTRRPLRELKPTQAARWLHELAAAVGILAEVVSPNDAIRLVDTGGRCVIVLRRRDEMDESDARAAARVLENLANGLRSRC